MDVSIGIIYVFQKTKGIFFLNTHTPKETTLCRRFTVIIKTKLKRLKHKYGRAHIAIIIQ